MVASIVLIVGYYTFGQADYFDRLFVCILLCLLLIDVVNRNFDFVALLLILLFERLSEEVFYFSMDLSYIKLVTYAVIVFVLYKLRYDKLVVRLAIPLTTITFIAELYWFTTNYHAPVVHYPLMLLTLNLITRHLIIHRVPYTEKLTGIEADTHSLDWPLYNIAKAFVYIISASLVEYLIRHLTHFSPVYIYNSFPFLAHVLTVLTLSYIIQYLFKRNFTLNF